MCSAHKLRAKSQTVGFSTQNKCVNEEKCLGKHHQPKSCHRQRASESLSYKSPVEEWSI